MEKHIIYIFNDYRGRHRKGVSIFNADYVNFQPKT